MGNYTWNCAIAVCAYNRPDCLYRCLESIFQTPDILIYKVPVYIFCDGGKNSSQQKNSEIISKYPLITNTFYQSANLCIANHIHYIRETIFDKMNFDRMMFIEEDNIVSPYFYRFMNRVLDCYQTIDPTVGMVNSMLYNIDSLSEKFIKKSYFTDYIYNIPQYIITKKTWIAIQPYMQEYMELFIKPANSYIEADYCGAVKWAKEKILNAHVNPDLVKRTLELLCGSQDSITNAMMRINNIRYVSSYVNRAINIGEIGFHSNKEIYESAGFGKSILDIIPEDANEIRSIYDMNKQQFF